VTDRPAHDVDCELEEGWPGPICACSYRASLVKLEREINEREAMHADCCVDRQEREEDRAAIRRETWTAAAKEHQRHCVSLACRDNKMPCNEYETYMQRARP
jgi:hypothetical protein